MLRPKSTHEQPFVGHFVIIEAREGLSIPALVTDYRDQYGNPQVYVQPVVGDGGYWTYASKVISLITPSDLWHRYLKGVAISCDGQTLK